MAVLLMLRWLMYRLYRAGALVLRHCAHYLQQAKIPGAASCIGDSSARTRSARLNGHCRGRIAFGGFHLASDPVVGFL